MICRVLSSSWRLCCQLKAWASRASLSILLNEMSHHIPDIDSDVLLSVVQHVFLPPELPDRAPTEDAERATNVALCHILIEAAQAFSEGLAESPLWQSLCARMIKMLRTLYRAAKSPLGEAELKGTLSDLVIEGGLELLSAHCDIVHRCFQMSSRCMFELRMPLSSFESLSIMFDSRYSKSPHQPAASSPRTGSFFAPIPVLPYRFPQISFRTNVFLGNLHLFSYKWMLMC